MHRTLLRHLRGNVVAYLALSIALGGTSYAAASLPRNSVGSAQLKTNAVTSSKVKNRSLGTADLSSAAIAALRGNAGPAGPAGAAGGQGPTGQPGATGAAGEKGTKGDKGDPSPVATGWSRGTSGATVTTDYTVTDLHTATGGTGSGALALPVQSRVFVTGSVDVANNSLTEPSRVSCTARHSGSGSNSLDFDTSPAVLANLHQADGDSTSDTLVYQPLSVTGSVLLDAGTYDFGIACSKTGNGAVLLNSASLNVIAVPASG